LLQSKLFLKHLELKICGWHNGCHSGNFHYRVWARIKTLVSSYKSYDHVLPLEGRVYHIEHTHMFKHACSSVWNKGPLIHSHCYYFFGFLSTIYFLYFLLFLCGDPKMDYNTPVCLCFYLTLCRLLSYFWCILRSLCVSLFQSLNPSFSLLYPSFFTPRWKEENFLLCFVFLSYPGIVGQIWGRQRANSNNSISGEIVENQIFFQQNRSCNFWTSETWDMGHNPR
jgi:hypothetical protein